MSSETGIPARDTYETAGTLYREAAPYIQSLHAHVQLHELTLDEGPHAVELSRSRLDEGDRELLR